MPHPHGTSRCSTCAQEFFLGCSACIQPQTAHSAPSASPSPILLHLQVGKGSQMKLVINMMMGAIMAVNAEGITLAQGLGLRVEDLMEVVNQGAMGTPMFKLKVVLVVPTQNL